MMVPPDFCRWNLYKALRAILTHKRQRTPLC